jgi:uncharacterized DUF497 family protein
LLPSIPASQPPSFSHSLFKLRHLFSQSFTIICCNVVQNHYYIYKIKLEWDENKSRINKSKHGIDFNAATELWNDQNRIEIQMNFQAENRNALIGKIEDKIWTAIFTWRLHAIRIISVRRARKKETKLYERN